MGGATRFLVLLTTNTAPSPLLPSLRRLSRRGRQFLPFTLLPSSYNRRHSTSVSILRPLKIKASQQQQPQQLHTQTISATHRPTHLWPEWSNFINNLNTSGYFDRPIEIDEELIDTFSLPEDFIDSISACVAFAREKPHLLGMLSRKDIMVVVDEGIPFLFRNGDDCKRRLAMSFLDNNVQNTDGAQTVDLMKFLLSYVSSIVSSDKSNLGSGGLESSVRHLFRELAQLSYVPQTNQFGSVQNQFSDRYGQAPIPLVQNTEMKRGDWICPRCSFMNFARNMKCLECHEARPKRQLSGGEWECPQCDFFNYGRNTVCLRCDCKRPGEISLGTTNSRSVLGYGNGSNVYRADVDRRLAENEEKAQRWFSKISQMDANSDMNNAIADEDFPEIMPLRRGVNRFVVSTRKTPLERRLSNAEYGRNLGYSGNETAASSSDDKTSNNGQNMESTTFSSASHSTLPQHNAPRGSNHVPFVPLPADMFAKKSDNSQMGNSEVEMESKSLASSADEKTISDSSEYSRSSNNLRSREPTGQNLSDENEKEHAEKSERWFKKVAELHNVTDLASEISDEDFPEIMPLRKGENRFVVSKRKDRSLTSPMYKRRMAMEQAKDTSFVPFVPFPPNYFAQKDNHHSSGTDSSNNSASGNSDSSAPAEHLEKLDNDKSGVPSAHSVQGMDNQQYSTRSLDSRPWQNSCGSNRGSAFGDLTSGNSTQNAADRRPDTRMDSWSSGYSSNENSGGSDNSVSSSTQDHAYSTSGRDGMNDASPDEERGAMGAGSLTGTTSLPSENRNIRDGWSGKSLEGSAVKEPDPLDMSEEAKAERWFRRVAQIKDISELSQIPDEDFPSIMPMRKGVNRFVVSKRKTPLERRLTSTQYRRNLPTMNSDPEKGNGNN